LLICLIKKYVRLETKPKEVPMQLSDALKIAETVVEDAEALGFQNTADAMRQVLKEMALIECASRAAVSAPCSIWLN
jgi:hypothetical protein